MGKFWRNGEGHHWRLVGGGHERLLKSNVLLLLLGIEIVRALSVKDGLSLATGDDELIL